MGRAVSAVDSATTTTTHSKSFRQTCCLDRGDRIMSGSVSVDITLVSARAVEQQHTLKRSLDICWQHQSSMGTYPEQYGNAVLSLLVISSKVK